jgi:hypothetical protein
MDRAEWLKAVYTAACRVAERHGAGLRKALESRNDDGKVADDIFHVAADTIAASSDLWPFIVFSRHPEPLKDDWRRATNFESAVVQVAVAALAADIRDMLQNLGQRALVTGPLPIPPERGPGGGGAGAEAEAEAEATDGPPQ